MVRVVRGPDLERLNCRVLNGLLWCPRAMLGWNRDTREVVGRHARRMRLLAGDSRETPAGTAPHLVIAGTPGQSCGLLRRPNGLGGSGILDDVRIADIGERMG